MEVSESRTRFKEEIIMDIRIFETAQEASKAGAKLIADVIKSQSATVLGLATGSTPVGMYQEWARMNAAGELRIHRSGRHARPELSLFHE